MPKKKKKIRRKAKEVPRIFQVCIFPYSVHFQTAESNMDLKHPLETIKNLSMVFVFSGAVSTDLIPVDNNSVKMTLYDVLISSSHLYYPILIKF